MIRLESERKRSLAARLMGGTRHGAMPARQQSPWLGIALAALSLVLGGAGCMGLRPSIAEPEPGSLRYAGYRPAVEPISGSDGIQLESALPAGVAVRDRMLRAGDPVQIVLRGPEETRVEDVIDENGMVNLPNIGRVQLSGMTTSQAEDAVARAYIDGGIYRRLTVNILFAQPRRESFFVYGEARGPGRYDFSEGITLMQAIATAGGLTDDANPRRVYVRRNGRMTRYNIRPMLRGDSEDVMLQPGDIITIRARWF